MLGLADFNIFAAYMLCIISAVLCIVYGIINWNKGQDNEVIEIQEVLEWDEKEYDFKECM